MLIGYRNIILRIMIIESQLSDGNGSRIQSQITHIYFFIVINKPIINKRIISYDANGLSSSIINICPIIHRPPLREQIYIRKKKV